MPVLLFMIITYVDQNFSLSDFHVCKVRVILYIVIVTKTYGAVMIRTIGCLFCLLQIGCTFDFLFLLFCLLLSKLFNVNFTSLRSIQVIHCIQKSLAKWAFIKKQNKTVSQFVSQCVCLCFSPSLSVCLSLSLSEWEKKLIFLIWFSAFGCHSEWTPFNTSCYHVSGEPTSWVDSMVSIRFVTSFCDEKRKGETYRKYLDKHKTK